MRRYLPLVGLSIVAFLPLEARAAGVVGTGTPASCTQAALAAALTGGGTVTFDCGPAAVTIPLTAEQVITASTTIDGADRIVLSGQNATRLFRVPDAPAPGVALTIRATDLHAGRCPLAPPAAEPGFGGAIVGGTGSQVMLVDVGLLLNTCDAAAANAGGGAVHVRGGTLHLVRVQGFGNLGSDGTIVNAHDSSVTIEDSSFISNSSTGRGGIVFAKGAGGGRIVLRRSRSIALGAPGGGGGVYASFDPGDQGLLVEGSAIYQSNSSDADGGAIYVENGPLVIDGSTFSDNSARRGGAVFLRTAALAVTNSTFHDNEALDSGSVGGQGGAFFLAGAHSGTVSHSTLFLNRAQTAGGAFASDSPSSPLLLRGNIMSVNNIGTVSPSCSTVLVSGGFNIQRQAASDPDCVAGIVRADPGLRSFIPGIDTPGWIPLRPDSLATNFVTSGCPPPSVDGRGITRPKGVACDAGAYEWAPTIIISDGVVQEGNAGSVPLRFVVRLDDPTTDTVSFAYATSDLDAVAGVDYLPASGVVTIPPGATEAVVSIAVLGDVIPEAAERFRLNLSAPIGARLDASPVTGRIEDDDTPPSISVQGCDVPESSPSCRFYVRTSVVNGAPVMVQYATASETATSGADFQSTVGTLTFEPGVTELFVPVPIVNDVLDETFETFTLGLSAPQNGTIGSGVASGVIRDDDGPVVSIGDVSTIEGDADQHIVDLTVTLSAPSVEEVRIEFGTYQGTAVAGVDYLAVGGQITFPPGETSRTAAAVVLGDTLDEPDERFRVVLSSVQNATVAAGGGFITIVDDDGGVFRVGELAHGAVERGDLVGPRDLYVLHQPAYSSWEVIVDEASGDVGANEGLLLERIAPDLTSVLQHSTPVGVGHSRTLQWVNNLSSGTDRDDYIGVASQGCSTDCGPDDVYRVRAYETTLRSARFNCRSGQRSAVVLQNRHRSLVEMWPQFWSESGQRILGAVGYAEPLGATVFDICAISSLLEDQSGSITVVHDGAYGQLAGKVVQIDPATGATFETPLTSRPR